MDEKPVVKTVDELFETYFVKGRADLSARNITAAPEYAYCTVEQRIDLIWKFLEQALKGR